MVGLLILLLSVKWCCICLWEHLYVGLKFGRVLPGADLKTHDVVITIVPVETLIGVSPVVQSYISVTFPYTFGLVGV